MFAPSVGASGGDPLPRDFPPVNREGFLLAPDGKRKCAVVFTATVIKSRSTSLSAQQYFGIPILGVAHFGSPAS